jgi:hAT family C-terminal dimerisation region
MSKVVVAVFSLYGSSAGTERSFKRRSRTHDKKRNRLSDDKVDKQACIVHNGKQLQRHAVALSTAKRTAAFEQATIHGLQSDAAMPLKEMLQCSCGVASAEAEAPETNNSDDVDAYIDAGQSAKGSDLDQ